MFDAILYINLEYRTDRKAHVLKELEKLEFITTNIYRIDACLEKWCGHLGCGKSHVKALELAVANEWNSVLIVEDDVGFVNHLSKLKEINDINWDVMMLGYGYHNLHETKYSFLKKVEGATTAHAYIVRKHYYQTLLNNFKDAVNIMAKELHVHLEKNKENPTKLHYCSAIDQYWGSLQRRDIFYTFEPILAQQGDLASDNNCEPHHQENLMNELISKTPHQM
jgi:hypothetical protein